MYSSIRSFQAALSAGTLSAYHFRLFMRTAGIPLAELAQLTETDMRQIKNRKAAYFFPNTWKDVKNAIEAGDAWPGVQQQARRMAIAEPKHFQLLKAILNLGQRDRYGRYAIKTYDLLISKGAHQLFEKIVHSLFITRLVDAQPRLLEAAS